MIRAALVAALIALFGNVAEVQWLQLDLISVDRQLSDIDRLHHMGTDDLIFPVRETCAFGEPIRGLYRDNEMSMASGSPGLLDIVFGQQKCRNRLLIRIAGEQAEPFMFAGSPINFDWPLAIDAKKGLQLDIETGSLANVFNRGAEFTTDTVRMLAHINLWNQVDFDPWATSHQGKVGTTLGVIGSDPREEGGQDGSDYGNYSKRGADGGNPCYVEAIDGTCLGGIRVASSHYVIVALFTLFFFLVCASLSLAAAFWSGRQIKYGWIAVAAACFIACGYGFYCVVTADGYLFGI